VQITDFAFDDLAEFNAGGSRLYIISSSLLINTTYFYKMSSLLVTIVKPCITKVTPIKRSKSLIGAPAFVAGSR